MRSKLSVTAAIAFAFLVTTMSSNANAGWSEKLNGLFSVSEFEGHVAFCDPPSPPVDVKELPGGVTIVTFINKNNVWVTGNELVDGVETNRVRARSEEGNPVTEARIRVRLDVAAYDGGWRIRQRLTLSPEGAAGFGIGVGVGDLRGRFIFFGDDTPSQFEPVPNPPCDIPDGYPAPFIVGAPLKGKVISLNWAG